MKNKKGILIFLVILILIITVILVSVTFLGGKINKEREEFKGKVEKSACEYVINENVTSRICEHYSDLCKINFKTLMDYDYLKNNLYNPIKKENIEEDKDSYIQVVWENSTPKCTYKEGRK